ncbi:MAG: hypothetical protein ABIJ34_03790 [archaeon]
MAQDNKSKILIFVLFVMVAIVFGTEVMKLINNSVDTISLEKKKIDCANIKFNVISSTYTNKRLILQLQVTSSIINVSTINIISDMKDIRSTNVTPGKNREEIIVTTIDNISISRNYEIYVEDCNNYKKSQVI